MRRPERGEVFDLSRVAFWVAFAWLAYAVGWLESVKLVSLLSILALAEGAWSAYRARHDDDRQWKEGVDAKLDELLGRERPAGGPGVR